MRHVYLGSVAGVFHAPQGPASGLGVLLVPPFGWDDQSTYRPRRAWATALAADGHAALRIDLPGTGDSGGGPRDADLAGAWRGAIADAVAWLSAERTAIVALGLGGLLALAAAPVDDLVLWGVPAQGRGVLRELKAFGRLEAAQTGEEPGDGPEGEMRAGGHVVSAATVAAITALELAHPPRRALVLGRDGVDPDSKLVAALTDAGTEVETDPGDGWGAALAGPQYAEVPTGVIARSRAWLAAPSLTASASGATAEPSAVLDLGAVKETPMTFAGGRFGILAEPAGPARGDLTAVLLNAGAVRHIGPNRMWVEAARRWAAAGVPTLRVDLEGIGESDGPDAPYGDDAKFYIPELTAQLGPILDATPGERVFLAGLCSGGYWALHTALRDDRVARVVMLNPRLLTWDAEAGGRRELRRALSVLTPTGFRQLLRADRPFRRLLDIVRWAATKPFRRSGPAGDPLDQLVAPLGERLELAFSGNEPLHDELDLDRVRALGAHVHTLPYRSHTLKPVGAQAATHALLDDALRRAQ